MKESNYYTPSIEDIREGYECEITYAKDLIGTSDEYFFKYIVDLQYFNESDYVQLRTPYLTLEQIEAEGWVPTKYKYAIPSFDKDEYQLWYYPENKRIAITKGTRSLMVHTLYKGSCPSINELRTITKLLEI